MSIVHKKGIGKEGSRKWPISVIVTLGMWCMCDKSTIYLRIITLQ